MGVPCSPTTQPLASAAEPSSSMINRVRRLPWASSALMSTRWDVRDGVSTLS
jgi:hypothetical protein